MANTEIKLGVTYCFHLSGSRGIGGRAVAWGNHDMNIKVKVIFTHNPMNKVFLWQNTYGDLIFFTSNIRTRGAAVYEK